MFRTIFLFSTPFMLILFVALFGDYDRLNCTYCMSQPAVIWFGALISLTLLAIGILGIIHASLSKNLAPWYGPAPRAKVITTYLIIIIMAPIARMETRLLIEIIHESENENIIDTYKKANIGMSAENIKKLIREMGLSNHYSYTILESYAKELNISKDDNQNPAIAFHYRSGKITHSLVIETTLHPSDPNSKIKHVYLITEGKLAGSK